MKNIETIEKDELWHYLSEFIPNVIKERISSPANRQPFGFVPIGSYSTNYIKDNNTGSIFLESFNGRIANKDNVFDQYGSLQSFQLKSGYTIRCTENTSESGNTLSVTSIKLLKSTIYYRIFEGYPGRKFVAGLETNSSTVETDNPVILNTSPLGVTNIVSYRKIITGENTDTTSPDYWGNLELVSKHLDRSSSVTYFPKTNNSSKEKYDEVYAYVQRVGEYMISLVNS